MADFDYHSRPEASLLFPPNSELQTSSHCSSMEQYHEMYEKSINDPAGFWEEITKDFVFKKPPSKENFLTYNFDHRKGPVTIKWMEDAQLNVCHNLLDRNVDRGLGNKIAFYWEGNDPAETSKITYSELLKEVCKFSNVLRQFGVKKGHRVCIYMPMIFELPIAVLACCRIGAVHSVVFAGFSSESLAERMVDAQSGVLITADGTFRGTKLINLKDLSDRAMEICAGNGLNVDKCIVVRHVTYDVAVHNQTTPLSTRQSDLAVPMKSGRDVWWSDVMTGMVETAEPEWMMAEDPLFMLYTSGSTGKPKGVLHTQAGYLLYAATTFKYSFDYQPDDVYWCTADIGWITGHTYIVYGPLANGATGVMFNGIPTFPDAGRFWAIVDKYAVTKFYTAPTAIRALMKFGDQLVKQHSRKSLKILATVGEPINPEAWLWYHNVVGEKRCIVVDTYWQTETGGHVITPVPGATVLKPGSATFPFFGVVPVVLREDGSIVEGEGEGYLALAQPWPGIMRTVYGNQERFETTYFKKFPGYYTTGDGVRRDADGYLWITGRIDDMMNVSGHLLSTAEVESALICHEAISESAVVSHPHPVKGECLYCFVTLKNGYDFTEPLQTELKATVANKIGPIARPDFIQHAPGLPKTRSGKIMRRVLRKIAVGQRDVGDATTLADPAVVDVLFELRPEHA